MAHITPCVKDGLLHFFEGGWQCGIRVESNTGLYTFGQRYYDTDLGRWTQMDPVGGTVGNPNSGNPYVYASDAPNMRVDPSGACDAFQTALIIVGVIGIFAAGFALLSVAVPTGSAIVAALTATTFTAETGAVFGFLSAALGFAAAAASALVGAFQYALDQLNAKS